MSGTPSSPIPLTSDDDDFELSPVHFEGDRKPADPQQETGLPFSPIPLASYDDYFELNPVHFEGDRKPADLQQETGLPLSPIPLTSDDDYFELNPVHFDFEGDRKPADFQQETGLPSSHIPLTSDDDYFQLNPVRFKGDRKPADPQQETGLPFSPIPFHSDDDDTELNPVHFEGDRKPADFQQETGLPSSPIPLPSDDDDPVYFKGNRKLPVLDFKDITPETVLNLVLHPNDKYVCKESPSLCDETASFLISEVYLPNRNDFKSDRYSWRNNGKKTHYLLNDENTGCSKVQTKPSEMTENMYRLTVTYNVHTKHKDFLRRDWQVFDSNDIPLAYFVVQYIGPECSVTPAKKPRVCASTVDKIKSAVVKAGPCKAYCKLFNDGGGMLNYSPNVVPSSVGQVQKIGSRLREPRLKDELYALIEIRQKEMEVDDKFIRYLECGPGPHCFVTRDHQLHDVERFCCNPIQFYPLGIDTTYNCGPYYVTPTTYRHLLLETVRGGNHPVMLGPMLLHKDRNETSFSFFGTSFVRLEPALSQVLAIGSDREPALGPFLQCFPVATNILCKKHFEDDLNRKLTELGINRNHRFAFIHDVFGDPRFKTRGLADCTFEEYDSKLKELKPVWDEREKVARNTETPKFHDWFMKYQAKDLREKLLYPIRRDVGLGYDYYVNNDPEGMHNRLKKRIGYKEVQWQELIKTAKEEVDSEREFVEQAVVRRGPYRLCQAYREFEVPEEQWCTWNEMKKKRHLAKLHACQVKHQDAQPAEKNVVEDTSQEKGTAVASPCTPMTAVVPGAVTLKGTQQEPLMSMTLEESMLNPMVFSDMWRKAEGLLQTPGAITDAPHTGTMSVPEAKMVMSKSDEAPHYVQIKSTGAIVCNCKGFKNCNLCSHVIAAGQKVGKLPDLITWYHSSKTDRLNLMKAASTMVKERNPGKKPGYKPQSKTRPKDKTSRNTHAAIQHNQVLEDVERETVVQYRNKEATPPSPTGERKEYKIKWLKGTRVTSCYGCGGKIRQDPTKVPEPPYDIVITTKEFRVYEGKEGPLRFNFRKENTHYHLQLTCIHAKNPHFDPMQHLSITVEDLAVLTRKHKDFLNLIFGINV